MKAIYDFKIPMFLSIINNTLDCGGFNMVYVQMKSLERKQVTKKCVSIHTIFTTPHTSVQVEHKTQNRTEAY